MKTAEAHNSPQVGSYKFTPKVKRAKAIWTKAFPTQAKALRPENMVAGGVKARSRSESVRMEIYGAIRALYLKANPFCECHTLIDDLKKMPTQTLMRTQSSQIHHKRGRDGLLLFDVRNFLACCHQCHIWIDSHRTEAQALGLLTKEGWRKQDA